ncbi:MAG TPA: hypothetical protein VJT13_18605, partial [Xanthobacteraceae bacterium]|nr:hypothetical protein [Xanthobacteraceae bacterium]
MLAKAQQKSIVDVGEAKPLPFAAAVVHEDLERRDPVLGDVARNRSELIFGRDDEVITEIDARAGLGHGLHLLEG